MEMFTPQFRDFRAVVKPGITGLWQIMARSDADLATQELLDTYYVRNWSRWLELDILIWTIPAGVNPKGAR